MNKKLMAKIKKSAKIPKALKPIDAFNPQTKERDMVRECINEGAHGAQFMETRNERSK